MSKDLFKSTAWYYSRYRPGYPEPFLKKIVEKFPIDSKDRMLDLGCGTGQITFPMSKYFSEVVGVDPEPQMLTEAKKLAKKKGIDNITWIKGDSEDLKRLSEKLGQFNLITIGRAFHWMDREKVLNDLFPITVNKGGVAIIGDSSLWTKANEWQELIKQIVQKYLGDERLAGNSTFTKATDQSTATHESVIEKSPFQDLRSIRYGYKLKWDIPHIIGYLYSTSFCSPSLIGNKKEQFEVDLTKTLLQYNSKGMFIEDIELYALLAWKN